MRASGAKQGESNVDRLLDFAATFSTRSCITHAGRSSSYLHFRYWCRSSPSLASIFAIAR